MAVDSPLTTSINFTIEISERERLPTVVTNLPLATFTNSKHSISSLVISILFLVIVFSLNSRLM